MKKPLDVSTAARSSRAAISLCAGLTMRLIANDSDGEATKFPLVDTPMRSFAVTQGNKLTDYPTKARWGIIPLLSSPPLRGER